MALLNQACPINFLGDDQYFTFGDDEDAGIGWDTDQTKDALGLFVSGSNNVILGTKVDSRHPFFNDSRGFGVQLHLSNCANSIPDGGMLVGGEGYVKN